MGPDIIILDLLKTEVRAREKNPQYGNKFCTSCTLMRVENVFLAHASVPEKVGEPRKNRICIWQINSQFVHGEMQQET